MKFYITTSSLNIDNILQSESILPISHYAQRLSGYKSFEQLDELRSFNAIVLFKYPVRFSINDKGRYNFPVLIEFEDDAQTIDFCKNEIQDGVCLCSHTLNLTPTNCRIFFFSEQEYKTTLVNTQSNKSIKYYKEYTILQDATILDLKPFPILKPIKPCDIEIYKEGVIDKQKGVLFAYILGGVKSINHDLAVQLRLEQEIYNILTSLSANSSFFTSFSSKLFKLLDEYKKVDETEKKSVALFDANFKKLLGKRFYFLKECFIGVLKQINCWDYVFDALCKRWRCSFLPAISMLNARTDFLKLRSDIETRTAYAVNAWQKEQPPSTMDDISIKGNTVVIAGASLINAVISYIIRNEQTPQTLYANRKNFYMGAMKEVVSILKEQMGETYWESSKEREYVNNLHAFIIEPTFHFEINSIDNIQLKSIAAFILKGQSYNDCVTLCKMNDFEDYRYVLSMWGALCGYMEMNKETLSSILNMSTYSNVYEKLYGKSMGILTSQNVGIESCNISKFSKEKLSFILNAVKYEQDITQLVDKIESFSMPLHECFEEAIKEVLPKKATKQKELAILALKIYQNTENYDALYSLLDTAKISKKPLSKNIKKCILEKYGYSKGKTVKNRTKETDVPSLFPEINKQGKNQLPNISSFAGFGEKVIRRLEQNWSFTESKHPSDKKEHIRHFINLCKKEGKDGNANGTTSLTSVFTEDIAHQVEEELLKYYGIRKDNY